MTKTALKDQTHSVALGWTAADFRLRATNGTVVSIADVRGKRGLLVIFMCNHCPYVQNAIPRLNRDVGEMTALGIGVVGINSNDPVQYPDDSFAKMVQFAAERKLAFPYAIDETQEVARAYNAACTPEFYGFDANLKLAYHGRIDAGGAKDPPAGSKRELLIAMTMIAETGRGPAEQQSSIGCSIKWKR